MKDGEFSIKIKMKEDGLDDSVKVSTVTNGIGITWKKIIVSTLDALAGLGFIIQDEKIEEIKEVIGYEDGLD